jgi:hypothetical protein
MEAEKELLLLTIKGVISDRNPKFYDVKFKVDVHSCI